jgi:hypothetical protein
MENKYKIIFGRVRVDLGEEMFGDVKDVGLNLELSQEKDLKKVAEKLLDYKRIKKGHLIEVNANDVVMDTPDLTIYFHVLHLDDSELSSNELNELETYLSPHLQG